MSEEISEVGRELKAIADSWLAETGWAKGSLIFVDRAEALYLIVAAEWLAKLEKSDRTLLDLIRHELDATQDIASKRALADLLAKAEGRAPIEEGSHG